MWSSAIRGGIESVSRWDGDGETGKWGRIFNFEFSSWRRGGQKSEVGEPVSQRVGETEKWDCEL